MIPVPSGGKEVLLPREGKRKGNVIKAILGSIEDPAPRMA
jgi:hypothetical protein